MGCCSSKEVNGAASRTSRWRSTGIVGLRDSKLKTIPNDVLDLERAVRTLDLTHNKIVDIPLEISKLVNVQRLILADNLIQNLPLNLGRLQSLKILVLDGNRITAMPDELGLLIRLERLSISGNLLSCLPETIGSLRSLQLLNVSNNKLKFLPESIGSCFSLEELQADGNSIDALPLSICSLIHLKSLSLNHNNVNQRRRKRILHPLLRYHFKKTTFHRYTFNPDIDRRTRILALYKLLNGLGNCENIPKIPPALLKDCKSLQSISLHDNPISMNQFQQMEGFQEFESRRKKKFDKQIDANVMINSAGLDEGLDLR